jgi:hypothetical protein
MKTFRIIYFIILIILIGCSSSLLTKGDYFLVVEPTSKYYGQVFKAWSGQLPDRWNLPNYVFGQNKENECGTVQFHISNIAKCDSLGKVLQ